MNSNRFSLFDTTVWAVRSVLDNFRLFFGSFLIMLGLFAAWIALLLLFSRFAFFWHQVPDMREFLWQFKLSGVLQPRTTEITVPVATSFGFFITLGLWFMFSLLMLGYTKLCVLFYRGENGISFSALSAQARNVGTFMLASLLFFFMVLCGLALFVLPGIYLFLRFSFFKYYIVAADAGIVESLRKSYALTAGYTWEIAALSVIALLALRTFFFVPVAELLFVAAYYRLTTPTH